MEELALNDIEKYIEILGDEFKKNDFDIYETYSDEEKLLALYAYYHYYGADSSKLDEIIHGIVFDMETSDDIAGVFIDQDSDNNDIDIILVSNSKKEDFQILSALKKLKDAESIVMSEKLKKQIRTPLKDILSDEDYQLSGSKGVKFIFLTDYCPHNASNKKSISNALKALKSDYNNVQYSIVFGYDIEHEVLEIENPREYVEDAILTIDKENNYLFYGEEQSMIVNISAKSLKNIYELYSFRGLFAQNLRYYVKNAKIDDSIVFSIKEKPDNFWYYNNGIIVVCDDYELKKKKLKIKKFSIINGGQTTKLVGETDFKKDFYIQCKIVKNKYIEDEQRIDFIADVAEASNTQKPIKGKDLIANKTEQRLLKKQLADVGIYCQIKRGEKVNKKLYPFPWQNTTNEELGQFLLSFVYQKPGTARSNKASICSNIERYDLIYGKKYNSDFLSDLLKIKAYYKLWMNYIKKNDDGIDIYKIGLINNGMLYMTSIIGAVSKLYFHPDYIAKIDASVMSEQKMEIISQHDIDHKIFKDFDDEKSCFFDLFEYCYTRFYRNGYEFMKSFKERYNNYSNFTKVNSNYTTYIFRQISYDFKNGIPDEDKDYLSGVFYAPSEEELQRDQSLLNKYVNLVYVDINAESSIPEETSAAIKEALVEYRTKTYKLNRIKAYEVFKNVAADRIAKFAPGTIEDLVELRCLDETQLQLYGEDIVGIVNRILNE